MCVCRERERQFFFNKKKWILLCRERKREAIFLVLIREGMDKTIIKGTFGTL